MRLLKFAFSVYIKIYPLGKRVPYDLWFKMKSMFGATFECMNHHSIPFSSQIALDGYDVELLWIYTTSHNHFMLAYFFSYEI